jgi:hypothetical protein
MSYRPLARVRHTAARARLKGRALAWAHVGRSGGAFARPLNAGTGDYVKPDAVTREKGITMFRRARLLFVLASLMGLLPVGNVATADEAQDVSNDIVAHIRQRLPSLPPPTPRDGDRISAFVHYIQNTVYYPTSLHDLKASAIAAIDAVKSPGDASSLVQAAITGLVDSIGHGARLLTTLGGDAPLEGAGASSRAIGSLWVVPLPTMNVPTANTMHNCADLVKYVGQPSRGVTGLVLDLRGNQGGPLTDSACLASLFLKKGQPLFQVIDKQGKVVKYESESSAHGLVDLPVAVLIDSHTDGGGLLVAAILQDHHRGTVIGEQNGTINGAVASLVFPPGANRGVILPTGEILLPDKRPLAAAVRVDVAMSARDDNALMSVALTYVARR